MQYLKQYSTIRKEVGELSKTSFPKSCVAIQKWFPSNQNMYIAPGVRDIMNAWRHKEEAKDEIGLKSGWDDTVMEEHPHAAPALQLVSQRVSFLMLRGSTKRGKMKERKHRENVVSWMKCLLCTVISDLLLKPMGKSTNLAGYNNFTEN